MDDTKPGGTPRAQARRISIGPPQRFFIVANRDLRSAAARLSLTPAPRVEEPGSADPSPSGGQPQGAAPEGGT